MKIFIPAVGESDARVFEVQCLAKNSAVEEIVVTGKVDASIVDSVQVAVSILSYDTLLLKRSYRAKKYHFHFTDGSFAKEGTSAGLGIALALLQAMYYVMPDMGRFERILATGEIDLNGDVYPVGGIEMKVSLIRQYKFDAIVMPEQEMPTGDVPGCRIVRVSNIRQLIQDDPSGHAR